MSGNRGPNRSSFGPESGFTPCSLMWSSSTTRHPWADSRLIPPAAFVRITARIPIRAITRIGNAASFAAYPSYRCTRPCIPATATSSTFPTTSFPAWPIAVERGKCGIFSYAIRAASENSSANAPSPEPSTSPIRGRSFVFDKMNFAARSARAKSSLALLAFVFIPCTASRQSKRTSGSHRSCEHRADSKPGELPALPRRECADAPDLDPDGAEICKPAQRERGNREGPRIERSAHRSQVVESHQFVYHHSCSQQIPDTRAIVPRDSDDKRNRGKHPAEHLLEARRKPVHPAVNPPKAVVHQRQHRQKRNQHGRHVDRQAQTIACAARDRSQCIGVLFHLRHLHPPRRKRLLGFRHHHLGHQQRSRRGHDDRGQQMLRLDPEGNVRRHDSAGDVRHPAGHHGHQLRLGQLLEKRPDG